MPEDQYKYRDIRLNSSDGKGAILRPKITDRPPLTPDELTEIGRCLWGERWQTDMANFLGLSDSARVRHWLTGYRPVPLGVRGELVARLWQQAAAAKELARRFK